jgi:hypothetical protein
MDDNDAAKICFSNRSIHTQSQQERTPFSGEIEAHQTDTQGKKKPTSDTCADVPAERQKDPPFPGHISTLWTVVPTGM